MLMKKLRENWLLRWAIIIPLGSIVIALLGGSVKLYLGIVFGCMALGAALGLLHRLIRWLELRLGRPAEASDTAER